MSTDTVVGTFGSRLRELRVRAGLSQAEVGAGRYSGSYVSHLESGRRQPSDEVVTFFAGQLGVSVDELLGADRHSYAAGSAALSVLEADSALWEAQRIGDPAEVCERAETVVRLAAEARRADLWWHAQRCRLHALSKLGRFGAACEAGGELARHPITLGSPQLECDVLAHLARAHRARGQLERAVQLSARAVELAAGDVPREVSVEALVVQVACLMDAGRVDEATPVVQQLAEIRDEVTSGQVLGQIAWVLGNVAFLTGDVDTGRAEHATALRLFRPEIDLPLWARFRQASARLHLQAGLAEDVAPLIDAAALALSLVGSPGDLADLETVRAEHALALGRPHEALLLCDGVLTEPTPLSPQSQADVLGLRHRARRALGDIDGARADLRLAAERYEQAGAWQRAVLMWRERAALEDAANDGVGLAAST